MEEGDLNNMWINLLCNSAQINFTSTFLYGEMQNNPETSWKFDASKVIAHLCSTEIQV